MIQLTAKWKLILSLLLLLALALADPRSDSKAFPTCGSGEYSHGSTFERNLNVVMNSLVRNVGETGYNVSTFGENEDKIYGAAQCRGDQNVSACGECVEQGRNTLLQKCHNFSAEIYLGRCTVFYQTTDLHGKTLFFNGLVCNTTNNTDSTDGRSLDWSIASLLTQLVENTVSASNMGYSTLSGNGVYALAQCWRELSMDKCRLCLNTAYKELIECPQGSLANRILYMNCIIRYDRYKFYGDYIRHISGSSVQSSKGMYKSSFSDYAAISKSKLNYRFQTLQIATNNFSQANKLGHGSFGSVYKGVLAEGSEIAVKRLFASKEQGVKEFFNEVNLVSGVQHKNLVKLFGCSVDGPDRLLVYEYIPNKSLDQFLFGDENMRKMLDWARRFEIILGIAAGITYLHEQSDIRIIHRDIKASNILLDQHFKSKIADFGLARYFAEDQSHLSTGIAGTLGYVAPDYVVHGQLTEKVDVYSFGVLVLEIISGRKNHGQIDSNGASQSLLTVVWNHYLSDTIPNIIDDNIEQNYHDEAMRVVYVALLCTQASATLRPPMSKVITLLTSNGPNLYPLTQPPFIDVSHSHSHSHSHSLSPSPSPSQSNIVDNSHNNSGYPLFNSALPCPFPYSVIEHHLNKPNN